MDNNIFVSEKDKSGIYVCFSKKELGNHKGISGLKYYLVVMYLRKHLQTFGQVDLTLNKLLEECGYSTRSHNKSIYSDFREIIKTEIINKGFATCNIDIFTINPNEMFTLNMSDKKSLFFSKDNFVQLTVSEYERICNSNIKNVNKSVLIGVYLFIKQYILADSDSNEHFAKISYPSKSQIKKGVGISTINSVENAISILEDINMIYVKRDMFIENDEEPGSYIPTRNVFALNKEELNNKNVLIELEHLYGKKVFTKSDLPGNVKFLGKEQWLIFSQNSNFKNRRYKYKE